MDALRSSPLLLLTLSVVTKVCLGKNQQQYIEPDRFIDFKYLTEMFILMTVALVVVMGVIIFLNVLIEDLFPKWKVHFGGGKDLGDDPFAAGGRRGSTSGNVGGGGGGGSTAAATPAAAAAAPAAAGKKKNAKKSGRKGATTTTSNVKDSKAGKKGAGAAAGQSKSKQGKDSKAKGSKAKDSKVSSAAKGGSSVAARK